MAKLLLLCNVERLPAWDDPSNTKTKAFGLNLSVAIDSPVDPTWLAADLQNPQASNPPMRAIFWPWKWKMPQVRLYLLDQAGQPLKDQAGVPLPPQDINLTPSATTLPAVSAGMETKFVESITPSQASLIWQLTPSRVSQLAPTVKPWHTLMGKASTFPYPVPQALNLSFIFKANIDTTVRNVFAAPILAAGNPFPSAATSPTPPKLGSDPRVLISDYDGVAELALQAYSAPCAVDVATGDFIDPVTQWVKDPDGNNYFDEDWLAALEGRMSDALDLSQVLILFLKDPTRAALLGEGDNLRLFARMTLAAIADVTGPGFVAPPDGARLIDKLLIAAQLPPLSGAEAATLRQTTLYGSVKDYRKLLASVFAAQRSLAPKGAKDAAPPGADYTMLRDDPPRISLQQTVTELEGLRGFLLETAKERNTLLALAVAQWQRLFTNASLPARVGQVSQMRQMADVSTPLDPTQVHTDPRVRDLRRQLTLSNLGRFWSYLIHSNPGDTNGRALVQTAFPIFFQYYLVQRFSLSVPVATGGLTLPPAGSIPFSPPWTDTVPTNLAQAISDHVLSVANSLVKQLLPDLAKRTTTTADPPIAAAPAQLNETPHAITLQVEKLAPLQDESMAFSDVLNRFSGVGILMRAQGDAQWLCINLGDLEVNKQVLDIGGDPALVPFRVTYRNQLRQVCASYDNRPLVADSPLGRSELTGWISDQKSPFDALITNRYSTKAVMPSLTFGRKYQFAIFAIANCGAIPAQLTAAGNPYKLASSLGNDATKGADLRTIPYMRRVRIGASRITDLSQTNGPIKAPVIPANVHPRARDLDVLKMRETPPGADTPQLSTAQMPLLLLTPSDWPLGSSKVEGLVSRPGTHWDCWDRWTRPTVSDATRQDVIADFFRTAQANSTVQNGQLSLTVDDPALAPWLYFELHQCATDGSLTPIGHRWVKIAPPPVTDMGLKSQRWRAVPFTCQWKDKTAMPGIDKRDPVAGKKPGDPGLPEGATITVAEGAVYRLGIYCAVIPDDVTLRFAPGVIDPAARNVPNDQDSNRPYLLVSPQFLAIEAATADLPDAGVVWTALVPDPVSAAAGQINVKLNTVSPHVHRAELTRQVWRWQGRDTRLHPGLIFPSPADTEQRTLAWEAVEFGDRSDADATIVPMRPNRPDLDGSRSFVYTEALQNSQGSSDLRSLHFRFSVTVFSRYEGLMPVRIQNSKTGVRKVPPVGDGVQSAWNRVFVPCRRQDGGNPPRVRLILPLTEAAAADNDSPSSPGLLVVFDEPWHETGGLAERLEARIALTADPSESPANLQHYYLEIGPDPILSHQPLLATKIDPADKPAATIDSRGMRGPVGHYFDSSNSAALFTCTSFILPAPRLNTTGASQDRRWTFAKLQFRRVLVTRLTEVPRPAPQEPRLEIADATYSAYTDAIWTQYLPSFSVFDTTSFLPGQVKAALNGTVLSLLNKDGSSCRLNPMQSDNASFSLYIVLTRRVFDVTGRADQEQFAGLFSQGAANQWNLQFPTAVKPASPDLGYRTRVIEVQRPPTPAGTGPSLWDDLFQSTADSDTPVRIVRISEPIDFGGAQDVDTCGGN